VAPRLVSFVSSLGCLFLIFGIVKKETKNNCSGIIAAGLYAATFRISGAWFDIARVDSLFLFLLLTAIYLVLYYPKPHFYIIAGFFAALSFFTKQTALVIILPLMVYLIIRDRWRSVFFNGTVLVAVSISILLLDHFHGGWFSYYAFYLLSRHGIIVGMFTGFWFRDLLLPLPIVTAIAGFYCLLNLAKKKSFTLILATLGLVAGSWFSRLHSGGYDNVLFPAYAALAILFGLGVYSFFEFADKAISRDKNKWIRGIFYLLCIAQFVLLFYNPLRQKPTRKDFEAGKKFIHTVEQFKGDIFVPYHGYLPMLAGKKSYAQGMAVNDILRSGESQIRTKLITEIKEAIREQRFSAIILDSDDWYLKNLWFKEYMETYYRKKGPVFTDKTVFWPVAGYLTRPEYIYIPNNDAVDGAR